MTLGRAAAARVRLTAWCKACQETDDTGIGAQFNPVSETQIKRRE
jgi:hypothetical protein